MEIVLALLIYFSTNLAYACSPLQPELVPPENPLGEWKEKEPQSEYELFVSKLSKSSQVAVVRLYMDFHYSTEPYNAQTEFSVIYGWGKPLPNNVQYVRQTTSCGRPKKLEEGLLYVALPTGSSFKVWPFSEVDQQIELLGEPDYRHTENGIVYP